MIFHEHTFSGSQVVPRGERKDGHIGAIVAFRNSANAAKKKLLVKKYKSIMGGLHSIHIVVFKDRPLALFVAKKLPVLKAQAIKGLYGTKRMSHWNGLQAPCKRGLTLKERNVICFI
jgi:hypothetical protein